VIAQGAELEQRYHAQIKARSVNLFLFHKGGRYPIEPREQDFSLRGTRHFISPAEMLEIAHTTPELLSPNVVLRPIAQDILLPTAVYVAGPSEIAYHAQLLPVYEHLGVRQPMLYPRASASFVEDRLQRVMERYQLELPIFFDDPEQIKAKVIGQIDEVKVDRLFSEADRLVADALNELRFGLKEIDQTLQGPLDGLKSKFDANLRVLREKATAAQQRRHEAAMRQIERAAGSLLPGSVLQERTLSILYYMNKYGPELVRWLKGEMDIRGFKHQLLAM
jgi:bacillithiol biosynthesis cysteine-adding enzyme BshC